MKQSWMQLSELYGHRLVIVIGGEKMDQRFTIKIFENRIANFCRKPITCFGFVSDSYRLSLHIIWLSNWLRGIKECFSLTQRSLIIEATGLYLRNVLASSFSISPKFLLKSCCSDWQRQNSCVGDMSFFTRDWIRCKHEVCNR